MRIPVTKGAIHRKLLIRITVVCLITAVIIGAVAVFAEYRRLDETLLDFARKESSPFLFILKQDQLASTENPSPALAGEVAGALELSSFIEIRLISAGQQTLLGKAREEGETIARRMTEKGLFPPVANDLSGHHMITGKRVYLAAVIPLRDPQTERLYGYIKGVYRLSLEDTGKLAGRLLLTVALACAGALLCGVAVYPGMVWLQNHLIISTAELNRANGYLLRSLGDTLCLLQTGNTGADRRTLIYAVRLAEQQHLPRYQIRELTKSGLLRRLSLVGLSKELKESAETGEKKARADVKKHLLGFTSKLRRYRWLRGAEPGIQCFSERYDGQGYPGGLAHEKIPVIARILAIAAAFEGLSASAQQNDIQEALRALEGESGTRFDPVLLAAFLAVAPKLYVALAGLEDQALEREYATVVGRYLKS